jgi:RNA polymerase sigma-70 factor (ECF subfamily)
MKAFEDIYALYKDDVYKFIYKLTCYKFDLSEELLQETFYQAFISFDRFRGECEVKTWLCQIAKNTYYRYIRNEIKKEQLTNKIIQNETEHDFTVQAEKKELLQCIHSILEDFDERTRNIVLYRMYADIRFSEIAAMSGMKESTAKVIYSRAKVKNQIQLKERFGYEI